MNYELIKQYCKKSGITLKELSKSVEMSEAGLYRSFTNNTLKVETLEKISKVLNVPISNFFNEDLKEDNKAEYPAIVVKGLEIKFDELRIEMSNNSPVASFIGSEIVDFVQITKQNESSIEKLFVKYAEVLRDLDELKKSK